MIAYQLHRPLFRRLCANDESLGRATLLTNAGASQAAKQNCGHFLFHIFPVEAPQDCHLALRMDRLLHAVDLGLDVRSLVVDPYRVVLHAWQQRRYGRSRNIYEIGVLPVVTRRCFEKEATEMERCSDVT